MNMNASAGLDALFENDRLDCAYEQIIIDFLPEFEADVVAKARENLARLTSKEYVLVSKEHLPQFVRRLKQIIQPNPMDHLK